jgi:hypothetical protein
VLSLFLLAPFLWVDTARADIGGEWVSDRGSFTVGFESSLEPIVINKIHTWTLHVKTADALPLSGATISVVGGMPLHNHGLPTRPRVSEESNPGDYRLDGMRFHMRGDWEIVVTIKAGGKTETVVIALQI